MYEHVSFAQDSFFLYTALFYASMPFTRGPIAVHPVVVSSSDVPHAFLHKEPGVSLTHYAP